MIPLANSGYLVSVACLERGITGTRATLLGGVGVAGAV
jgi:hypothetical protein